jgi:serine protease Do
MHPARAIVLSILALALAASDAGAQPVADRGKKFLPRLFAGPASAASAATVRVLCDDQDAALGTVVTADGFILTKGSELRGTVTCRLPDGRVLPARSVGYHKPTDLALLKVEAADLKPVEFAPGADTAVGTWVAAAGPGSEPIAVGVLSAPVRKLYREESFVENANKGYLGILGMRDAEFTDGVVVGQVDPVGAAARAGMRAGDVIVEVAGKPTPDRDALIAQTANRRPGDRIAVRVRRGEEELALDVMLTTKNPLDRGAFQSGMGGALSGRRTGFPAVLQHDTVLRPTDCGGPLVDLDGKVLGLNIARAGRVETWALPREVILPILPDLKAGKYGDGPTR